MPLINATLSHPDYGFTVTDKTGNQMKIDIPVDDGGHGAGMRPMQTLLAALAGCSGVDVVSILKKQRQNFSALAIEIDGERETGKEPSLWQSVQLLFKVDGEADPAKVYRAAELSITKYCSVAETLRRSGTDITWSVQVNGTTIKF